MNDLTNMSLFNFKAITEVYEQAKLDIADMSSYILAIAGIGALIYFSAKIWKEWVKGDGIDIWGCLRPFAILLLIINFNLLPTLIDTLTSPFIAVTAGLRDKTEATYLEKQEKFMTIKVGKRAALEEELNKLAKEKLSGETTYDKSQPSYQMKNDHDETGWFGWVGYIKNAYANYMNEHAQKLDEMTNGAYSREAKMEELSEQLTSESGLAAWINEAVGNGIYYICQVMCTAIQSFIMIFAYLTKIILFMLGPVVLAISMFPKYDHLVVNWISRYINVCLWIPICNIIGYIMQSLVIKVALDPAIASAANGDFTALNAEQMSNNFVLIVFMLITSFLYMKVPSIADWIISGNGSGMFAESVGAAAGALGVYAGAKAGGAMAKGAIALGRSAMNGARALNPSTNMDAMQQQLHQSTTTPTQGSSGAGGAGGGGTTV